MENSGTMDEVIGAGPAPPVSAVAALIRRLAFWAWTFGLVALLVIVAIVAKKVSDVAAVEAAVNRDWEITFASSRTAPGRHPKLLPSFVDSSVGAWFDWRFAHTVGYDGTLPPKTRNRSGVYQTRFRSIFHGAIDEIRIVYPEGFQGDELGAALGRFPALRIVEVYGAGEPEPAELEWKRLCARLRNLLGIEELELAGAQLTDAAIAPLAGHPTLRSLIITDGRLTTASIQTFAAIPSLATLYIDDKTYSGDTWISADEKKAMRAALPAVTITLP